MSLGLLNKEAEREEIWLISVSLFVLSELSLLLVEV